MESIPLYEAKNRLSAVCEEVVRSGRERVITRRGQPWVRLVPMERSGAGQTVWDSVEEEESRYGPIPEGFELPTRRVGNRSNPLEG